MIRVGDWELEVSDPHPVWISIYYSGGFVARIRHQELADLRYALDRAMREAKSRLPEKYRHEVGDTP